MECTNMNKNAKRIISVGLLALLITLSGAALADPGRGKGHGPGDDRHGGRYDDRKDRKQYESRDYRYYPRSYSYYYYGPRTAGAPVVFVDRDRTVIHRYVTTHYSPRPVYHVTRGANYVVGRPLPSGVLVSRVPDDLLIDLNPPPLGHYYGMVDRDVLLLNAASHNVIDAVTYLSAIN